MGKLFLSFRVTHKRWAFRDDCTELTLSVSSYLDLHETVKELSLCRQLWFFPIWVTQCCGHLIFQTINYVIENNLSLKCLRFTPKGFIDIGIRIFDLGAKTAVPLFFSSPNKQKIGHSKTKFKAVDIIEPWDCHIFRVSSRLHSLILCG